MFEAAPARVVARVALLPCWNLRAACKPPLPVPEEVSGLALWAVSVHVVGRLLARHAEFGVNFQPR